jgi:hypothetical protein
MSGVLEIGPSENVQETGRRAEEARSCWKQQMSGALGAGLNGNESWADSDESRHW